MRRFFLFFLSFVNLVCMLCIPVGAVGETENTLNISAPSALLCEAETGKVLFEKNSEQKMPMASVTKIMTALLTFEALDSKSISLDDIVVCSEKASKMTGSKVFISLGEKISVNDLIKSLMVASGNDAAVLLAEHISGSEDLFVEKMNQRAAQLGMVNTHFVNCTGLDADDHYTTAKDISIMSRQLLSHKDITKYTTIWIDTLRDGKFMLSNTNRLIRFYEGATGLKTGSTSKAKFCVSASAMRNGMHLIAVILGAETSDKRFADARLLLDYGFANFALASGIGNEETLNDLYVIKGMDNHVKIKTEKSFSMVVPKGSEKTVKKEIKLSEDIMAPVEEGQKVGEIKYYLADEEIGKVNIVTESSVRKIDFFHVFSKMLSGLAMLKT